MPQPFPKYYIIRPEGNSVPLIPLDELPSWIRVGTYDWNDPSLYMGMTPVTWGFTLREGEFDVLCLHCISVADNQLHRSVSQSASLCGMSNMAISSGDKKTHASFPLLNRPSPLLWSSCSAPASFDLPQYNQMFQQPFVGMCLVSCGRKLLRSTMGYRVLETDDLPDLPEAPPSQSASIDPVGPVGPAKPAEPAEPAESAEPAEPEDPEDSRKNNTEEHDREILESFTDLLVELETAHAVWFQAKSSRQFELNPKEILEMVEGLIDYIFEQGLAKRRSPIQNMQNSIKTTRAMMQDASEDGKRRAPPGLRAAFSKALLDSGVESSSTGKADPSSGVGLVSDGGETMVPGRSDGEGYETSAQRASEEVAEPGSVAGARGKAPRAQVSSSSERPFPGISSADLSPDAVATGSSASVEVESHVSLLRLPDTSKAPDKRTELWLDTKRNDDLQAVGETTNLLTTPQSRPSSR